MKRIAFRHVAIAFMVLACALYLPELVRPVPAFYVDIMPPVRLQLIGAFGKLACLVLGTVYSYGIAKRLEKTNAARTAWALLSGWQATWTVAQLIMMYYSVLLRVVLPVPSLADAFFLVGFALMYVALARFIGAYRGSGFPVGSAREHAAIAGVSTVIVVTFSYVYLARFAHGDDPPSVRFLNVGYPTMDLLALVPTLVLIRIALAFRPGRVWAVWASLLLGFVSTAVADVISTYLWPTETAFDPLIHLAYLLGYFFVACGTKLQLDLVKS